MRMTFVCVCDALAGGVGSSQDGTKEWAECSNRGSCARDTGLCECFEDFGPSDGAGNSGNIADCGYNTAAISDCPGSCEAHGDCSGAPDYVCTCYDGFTGGDCGLRTSARFCLTRGTNGSIC